MTAWIEELERLCREATPGPWEWRNMRELYRLVDGKYTKRVLPAPEEAPSCDGGCVCGQADTDLIAAMRNALPRLLAAARQMERISTILRYHEESVSHERRASGQVLDDIGECIDAYREAVKASTPRPDEEGGEWALLQELQKLWGTGHPHLRLGQLLCYLGRLVGGVDPFYLTNESPMEAIRRAWLVGSGSGNGSQKDEGPDAGTPEPSSGTTDGE